MALVALDTEFYNSNEAKMKVVAAVLTYPDKSVKYNLLDDNQVNFFKIELQYIKERGDTLIAHAVTAEARSLIALGLEPLDFKWVDTYVEFIMLCNSNDKFSYGNYLNSHGDVCHSVPPDPTLSEEEREADTADHTETPKGLVNATYKMLGVRLDQEEKDTMRDLILSKNLEDIQENMQAILDYCESDTKYLIPLYDAIADALRQEGLDYFYEDQLQRGRYAAASGKCENLGMPINTILLDKIILETPTILDQHKKEVNKYFPFFTEEFQRPPKTFKNGKVFTYKPTPAKKDMGAYQKYVESLNIPDFPRTDTGKYKADKKTLPEYANKHRYTQGLDYLLRYTLAESSLKWFNKDNKNGFFDRFSDLDECVRPFYGIFGTQTGRNAAKAKTFPLAMSSWLRCIVQPRPGSFIIGCDFSQQEVYVAAKLSGDDNLLQAYNSGDVYLAFAKQAGLVPRDATKQTHKLERTLCKSTVLG